ncbi:hypothetical protein BO85DRAFT_129049 [Aspergillus piperis CBS 112811]|uniref:Uncharacterized protein n=1 Tax=Aspergillus piperis CBS 112811 TaxID=1448313 RepID=A0A8G1R9R5_9EURO|nr:hypothetical protein BO85DRAFT_129049 [Aspergillus piperis CBS 112811]RAH62218.1 hypothetical protein BO85DRAFT_129049 [Aspergillus piperis CBS 112811]
MFDAMCSGIPYGSSDIHTCACSCLKLLVANVGEVRDKDWQYPCFILVALWIIPYGRMISSLAATIFVRASCWLDRFLRLQCLLLFPASIF